MAKFFMGGALLAGYGALAVEGVLFLAPPRTEPQTRKLFVGKMHHYQVGQVKKAYDLQGVMILIKRKSETEFQAFSSVCPHLGCMVHWEEKNQRFFCPCHNGVFNAEGVAIAGPPAKAHQRLKVIPITVDKASQRVYIDVKDVGRRRV